jgi:hypothetical protein
MIHVQVVYERAKLGISFLKDGQQRLKLRAWHIYPEPGEHLLNDASWHHAISLYIKCA